MSTTMTTPRMQTSKDPSNEEIIKLAKEALELMDKEPVKEVV